MGLKSFIKKSPLGKLHRNLIYRRSDFFTFEQKINKESYPISKKLIHWSNTCLKNIALIENESSYQKSDDRLVQQGYKLKEQTLSDFKDKRRKSSLRLLVHLPDQHSSPAGYSIFSNFISTAHYLGINIEALKWGEDTDAVLDRFKPNVFLSSDSPLWLKQIDWIAIKDYRKKNMLHIGLTASLEEEGNSPLEGRLNWAKKKDIQFYYCYDPKEYLKERQTNYQAFYDRGYNIYSYEYTFNPLLFYPIPGQVRDIPYIMLGSGYNNKDKRNAYIAWFSQLWQDYPGCIYGPGWKGLPFKGINPNRDRYLYSRGKVGLNLSIPRQLKWHASLNERTYMLAACGIPQLSDRALLLDKRFNEDEIFIADNPEEYSMKFKYILSHENQAEEAALKAQKKVFNQYTNFHSVCSFLDEIETLLHN